MKQSFNTFLNSFLDSWKTSSLTELAVLLSKDYKAREISDGEIVDFGFEESI